MKRWKRGMIACERWAGGLALCAAILLSLGLGYGTRSADAQRLRAFSDAVNRWQRNPDFRLVQAEYVDLGYQAMRTHICGISSGTGMMALRSLPGLPDHLAVNATSAAHYRNFTAGPLSAYLHLSQEQGLNGVLGSVTDLGRKTPLTDDDVRAFLSGFKLHNPVAQDAGAIQGVRRLLADTNAANGFTIHADIPALLRARAAELAAQNDVPDDVELQQWVWLQLDSHIRQHDYEFWRTKQINDFLSGIWAQAYGPMYNDVIVPVLHIHDFSRPLAPALILLAIAWLARSRRRSRDETANRRNGESATGLTTSS